MLEGIALASDPDYKVCLLGTHALWLTSPELGRWETQPVKDSLGWCRPETEAVPISVGLSTDLNLRTADTVVL